MLLAGAGTYLLPSAPLAFLCVIVYGLGLGCWQAGLIALFITRYPALRGPIMGLNGSGNNLGLFFGAALGGVTLGLGSYVGLAVFLTAVMGLALGIVLWTLWAADCAPPTRAG